MSAIVGDDVAIQAPHLRVVNLNGNSLDPAFHIKFANQPSCVHVRYGRVEAERTENFFKF